MKKNGLLCLISIGILLLHTGCSPFFANKDSISTTSTFYITYSFTMISNHHVGNDWHTVVSVNDKPMHSGDILNAASGATITVKATVIEQDSMPDRASVSLPLQVVDGACASTIITVRENKGRYVGNTAKWEFTATIRNM